MKWVDSLLRIKELATTNVEFRHGIHYIPASSIAEQYYCEQKVEMTYTVGDIETETKVEGRAIHDALLQMEKLQLRTLLGTSRWRICILLPFQSLLIFQI